MQRGIFVPHKCDDMMHAYLPQLLLLLFLFIIIIYLFIMPWQHMKHTHIYTQSSKSKIHWKKYTTTAASLSLDPIITREWTNVGHSVAKGVDHIIRDTLKDLMF